MGCSVMDDHRLMTEVLLKDPNLIKASRVLLRKMTPPLVPPYLAKWLLPGGAKPVYPAVEQKEPQEQLPKEEEKSSLIYRNQKLE